MGVKNMGASKKKLILNYLAHQEGYTSVEDLSSTFKISKRTVYYIFNALNKELLAKKWSPFKMSGMRATI